MSDWKFLSQHRHRGGIAGIMQKYISDDSDGFNGLFRFMCKGILVRCIASDGEGWQHVSVTIEGEKRPPPWDVMCEIKDLFWQDEDVVIQFHPAKSQYINNHSGCLHLWRPTAEKLPIPPTILVGTK